jgi:hypothetical protein
LRVSPCARLIFGKGYQILIKLLEDEVRVMPSSYAVGAHFEQFIRDQVWASPVFVDSGLSSFLVDHTVF